MEETAPSTSLKFHGISYNKHVKKWEAKIKRTYIGIYTTPEEAAKAWDIKAIELYGNEAILNFPNDICDKIASESDIYDKIAKVMKSQPLKRKRGRPVGSGKSKTISNRITLPDKYQKRDVSPVSKNFFIRSYHPKFTGQRFYARVHFKSETYNMGAFSSQEEAETICRKKVAELKNNIPGIKPSISNSQENQDLNKQVDRLFEEIRQLKKSLYAADIEKLTPKTPM
jgi:hypothetical protein